MPFVIARRDFEHSCDQVTFRMPLSKKNTITATEGVHIQVCFLTIGSKNNNNTTINTWNACNLHTIQRLDLLKTRESRFSFVWDM